MIYNRSGHPVEIKKISIRLWSLRDEIEAAIGRRMKECEAAGIPLFIEDIKKFYNLDMQAPLTEQDNVIPLHPPKQKSEEEMIALMESLGQEVKTEGEEAKPAEAKADGEAPSETVAPEASPTFVQAEETLAAQTSQGLETKKPNPMVDRPFERQPPDLDKISYGFSFLSDINMDSILSFTKDKFLHGQAVVVEFLIPQNFIMTATVNYCHHYAMRSRIISSTKPDYRVQCKFRFSIPGERENLRNFLRSIEPTIAVKKEKPKKPKEDDVLDI